MPRSHNNHKTFTEAYWTGNDADTITIVPGTHVSLALDLAPSFDPVHQIWTIGAPLPAYLTGQIYIKWDLDVLVTTGAQKVNVALFKNNNEVVRDGDSSILANGALTRVHSHARTFLTGGDIVELKLTNLISTAIVKVVNGNIAILR